MPSDKKSQLLLEEEQTILSRERTMHSYMQTGLGFIGAGLLAIKFLDGILYATVGVILCLFGVYLLIEAMHRFTRYRKMAHKLRKLEKANRLDIGE